jgi:enediyne biosynthesis protein E4
MQQEYLGGSFMEPVSRRSFAAKMLFSVPVFMGLSLQRQSESRDRFKQRPAWFSDVAGLSHFPYKTNNDFTGRKYFPQPMCGGVAVLDYDNDGKMDIFFTNGAKLPENKKTGPAYYNALLRNIGDHRFEDVTLTAGLAGANLGYSFGVAAADYDNDGNTDLFLANLGRNTLYHNNGDGTFTDVTAGSGLDDKPESAISVGAAWFDYDNDGLLDLFVTNYTTWVPENDKRCIRDKSTDAYCSPTAYPSIASRLYRNLGHDKFEDVTESSGIGAALGKGMGIAIADFNQDGKMDIFVANDTERNFLFINQGDGTFKEQGLIYGVAYNEQGHAVSAMGTDAKDYDNDGRIDVVYNDLMGEQFGLLRNQGVSSFDDVARSSGMGNLSLPLSGWSIGFIDYNNDGWKDIYSANGDVDNLKEHSKQRDSMFQNQEGKIFKDVSGEMGPDFNFSGYQRGSAFVDLNNDGFIDIVTTSLGERPRILINNGLSRYHWVTFDLRGYRSNRDGIGATIKVTTASGRALYNHVTTSVGFMSSSDKRVHFGLGTESAIKTVEICWPSCIVQRLDHPAIDRIVKVDEPDK